MKPSELSVFLSHAIKARLPILITGAPGIGKSDIVAQAAAAAGAELILSHPAVADPTDAKGLPWVAAGGDSATFLPFGELARAIKATEPTVWFLDDLGQAPPSVQASFMQLLLARRVNGHTLPDCVTFVAATNRRTDKAAVSGILEPVKSRFAAIVELDTHVDEWCLWALNTGWMPAEVVAFIRFRPDLLMAFKPSADLTNSPVPRTWAHAGRLVNLQLPAELELAALAGAIGEGAAVEFLSFLRLLRELPNIDGILLNPDKGKIPTKPAVLYAVTTALGMKATAANFDRIAVYINRLMRDGHGEFAALLARDASNRCPEIQETTSFIKLAAGELGRLIGGN